MSFLSPWSLLWLGAVPVLLWLWRLVSARRRVVVPSLVPFEHLLARTPKRRGRLIVNALFWLQLAALTGLALALAQPVLFQRHARLVLAILDTSASMTAGDTFEQARRALLVQLAGKPPTAQVLIVTTAPVLPLLPQATSDPVALTRALEAARPSHLGGNLSTTERIGRALLAAAPDETLVVTDEPRPKALPGSMRWIAVGSSRPNAALVGLDAQGPLCSPSDARVIATVQNFSGEPSPVELRAAQGARRLAEARVGLGPYERRSVSLAVPEATEGAIELSLTAPRDALEADNHAWLDVGRSLTLPVIVRAASPAIRLTLSSWLGACQALAWTTDDARGGPPALAITDRADSVRADDAAALVFVPASDRPPVVSHWLALADHPIGAYLPQVVVVSAKLNPAATEAGGGVPVISALMSGREVPVILAHEREGRRTVEMRLDPSGTPNSPPLVLSFFNSLRWLMGRGEARTPGEPLTAAGFGPGTVQVRRPDGSTASVESIGGLVRYDDTTLSGRYRFLQGGREQSAAVNFFNPLESNLSERVSTWRPLPEGAAPDPSARRAAHPLANLLVLVLLGLLLIEWWRYGAKGKALRARGAGLSINAAGRPPVFAQSPEPRAQSAFAP